MKFSTAFVLLSGAPAAMGFQSVGKLIIYTATFIYAIEVIILYRRCDDDESFNYRA